MDQIRKFIFSISKSLPNSTSTPSVEKPSLLSQYNSFLHHLRQLQHTRQYRSAISKIEQSFSLYTSLHSSIHFLYIIKAQCILKIISHKLRKYQISLSSKNFFQVYSISFWFNHLFLLLEQLILLFRYHSLSNESILNDIEQLIQLHIDTLYHLALFDKIRNNITQMCSYFAMVDNIKQSFHYCRHPRTLNIYRKIYLLRAVTLIGNRDYDSSLKYQKMCVDISFREFFLIVDFDEGIDERKHLHKDVMIRKILKRNFVDMIIAFYLRGVCYEYLGDLSKSIEAYKQIRWFSNKFISESEPELTLFCNRIEKRALLYFDILNEVHNRKVKMLNVRKRKENKRNMQIKQSLLSCKSTKHKQIKSNEIYTNKIEYNDNSSNSIEYSFGYRNNKSNTKHHPKTQYIMSTVKLINTLLEKDYMPILNEMNTVEINKYDKEIHNKIFLRKTEMSNTKRNKPSLIKSQSSSSKYLIFSGPNVSTLLHNNSINKSTSNKYKQSVNISFSPSVRYNPSKVQKLKYDNEQFNKEYIQKKNFLEKVNKKETAFLKKVLESKKVEKMFHINFPDPNKMEREAQSAFSLGLSLAKTIDKRTALQKLVEDSKVNINEIISNKYQGAKKAGSVDDAKERKKKKEKDEEDRNSLSQNYFKYRKNVPPDLSNNNIVNKLNNDMIKKLNFEYEFLTHRGNSLNEKKGSGYNREIVYHK